MNHLMNHTGSLSSFERAKQMTRASILSVVVVMLAYLGGCADSIAPPAGSGTSGTFGVVTPGGSGNTGVGALLGPTGFTGCSVAFISERFAVTAARCVAQQPNGPYQVALDSPITPDSMRLGVSNLFIHPWWNSAELGKASEHVAAVRQGATGYYRSNPSYDIALIELTAPKLDGVYFERLLFRQNSVDTLYFATTPSGNSRSEGTLNVAEGTPTTITSIEYSLLSTTQGGGAAVVALDNGRSAIMGVASASGPDQQGMLFTQINPHANFIVDVMTGVYSPSNDLTRYRVNVSGDNPGPGPGPGPDPTQSFDCAVVNDGFCDANCSTGADPDCAVEMPMRSGAPFGAPCQSGIDCITGLCLMIGDERSLCSDRCNPNIARNCPPLFECVVDLEGEYVCAPEQMMPPTTGGSDPVELRLFGADCSNDAQCTTNVCINYEGSRWCSMRCMMNSDCPLSYACESFSGRRACVPPRSGGSMGGSMAGTMAGSMGGESAGSMAGAPGGSMSGEPAGFR